MAYTPRFTLGTGAHLVDLLHEMRDAVADIPGFTMASSAEEALRA